MSGFLHSHAHTARAMRAHTHVCVHPRAHTYCTPEGAGLGLTLQVFELLQKRVFQLERVGPSRSARGRASHGARHEGLHLRSAFAERINGRAHPSAALHRLIRLDLRGALAAVRLLSHYQVLARRRLVPCLERHLRSGVRLARGGLEVALDRPCALKRVLRQLQPLLRLCQLGRARCRRRAHIPREAHPLEPLLVGALLALGRTNGAADLRAPDRAEGPSQKAAQNGARGGALGSFTQLHGDGRRARGRARGRPEAGRRVGDDGGPRHQTEEAEHSSRGEISEGQLPRSDNGSGSQR
mmetsp:Transcript_60234/g.138187  ORF Transcript_60234/g.138187 Transcript_60234/m.138187 type:complete len:297 (-) Transcript_60234:170-1060(-)